MERRRDVGGKKRSWSGSQRTGSCAVGEGPGSMVESTREFEDVADFDLVCVAEKRRGGRLSMCREWSSGLVDSVRMLETGFPSDN